MKSFALIAGACFAVLLGAGAQNAFAAPTVSITSPTANKNFGAPATISITATATPSAGTTISRVDFFQGTTQIGTKSTPPYTITWTNVAIANYSLTAKAFDSAGGTKTSAAIAITVKTNVVPTVSISAPAANASFSTQASIPITATATDTDGTIAKVDFLNGTTLLGTATTSPFTIAWTGVPAGSYSLTAKATDNSGGVKTSTAVAGSAIAPPTISVTAPASNATFTAPATIPISATATAATGATISKVEFLNGTTVLGSKPTSPFTFSWTSVAAGSYSITARATDSKLGVTTSAAVPVTVTSPPPTVSISSPANNATFAAIASIPITAAASAAAGATIRQVDFYSNGTNLLGSKTVSPFTFTWTGVTGGSYSLTAKATDSNGATKTSTAVAVNVTAPPPPTVSISAPANNASFTAPASITINATATPGTGAQISKVEFLNGSTVLGSKNTSPFTFTWTGVVAGSYSLTARATDNKGSVTISAAVAVTVNAPVSRPTVAITSPTSGATFAGSGNILITATATATAPGATINRVDFYNGAALLGTSFSPPYTFNWTSVPAGAFLLSAKATDSFSVTGTSALVYAIVDGADSCTTSPPLAANDASTKFAGLGKLPMTFEVNAGQANPDVLFQARGSGYQLFLTPSERVLALQSTPQSPNGVAVRTRFVGANPQPAVTGVDPLAQRSNYLVGSDRSSWHTNVPNFAKVRYEALYPGIDELYYGSEGKLEYDLHIAPGANPRAIRFAIDGVDKLAIDRNGDLLLKTSLGTLVQRRPVAYQEIKGERRAVTAKYQMLASNEVTFKIGKYDSRYALVIDPVLVYSTYVGGTNDASAGAAIAISRCGEAFVAGWTWATDYPITAGAFEPSAVTGTRMGFVSKLNQAGTGLLYSTYVTGTVLAGSTQDSMATSIAVDAVGHAYIVGNTSATDFPTTPGSLNPSTPSGGFVAKLNTDGSAFLYSTYLSIANQPKVAVDSTGSAYIAADNSVYKLNASGSAQIYAFGVGDLIQGIAVDGSGNAYAVGSTSRLDLPVTAGAFQTVDPTPASSSHPTGFIAEINPSGTGLVYSSYLGTAGYLYPNAVAVDSAGNAYVTGMTDLSSAIPNFTGTYASFNRNVDVAGNWYAFVAKMSAGGSTLAYFSRIGGAVCDTSFCSGARTQGNAIAVDQGGNAWITGTTASNEIPLVNPLHYTFASGPPNYGTDLFAVKLAPAGNSMVFSTLLGGLTISSTAGPNGFGAPSGAAIAVDSIGSAYVSGTTNMTDFPTTAGAFQTALGASAGASAFAVKINETKDSTTALVVTPNPGTVSNAVTLTANITGNAPTGTVTFLDGLSTLGTASVSGASAVFTTSQLAAGAHDLTANYGGDAHNNPSTTMASINIADPTRPPTVTLTGLTDGASFFTDLRGQYVSALVTASADAAPGNILNEVKVSYAGGYLGNYRWIPLTQSFSGGLTLPPMFPNVYTISASATDNYGNTASTPPIRIVINSTGWTPPLAVAITAPATGSTFVAPGPIVLTASATPAGGSTIGQITYYDGSTWIGAAAVSPFTVSWRNPPVGTHSLIAQAVDHSTGGSALSAAIIVTVTPAPLPPTVSITSPANNSVYTVPANIPITASAVAANGATINKVDFYNGTTLLGTAASPPYTFTWLNVAPGNYSLTAQATDSRGSIGTSAPTSITVAGTTVGITAPSDGAVFVAPASFALTAQASTSGGTIAQLDFYDGTALLGTITVGTATITATVNLTGVIAGSHVYTVKATHSTGSVVASAPVNVNVATAPTLALTSPAANAFYIAPAYVNLSADASSVNGTIQKVEFFQGASLVATVTTPPYLFTLANAGVGSYSFTAKATDSSGFVATSDPVSITVGSAPAIAVGGGIDGSTVNGDTTSITGTLQAPPNSSVTINGAPVTVTAGGQFFINDLPVQPGLNTLTLQVTTQDGQTSTQTISVTGAGSAPFNVSVSPIEGIGPLDITFTVENPGNTPFATVEFDVNGDGTADYIATSQDTVNVTFTLPPGLYPAKVTFKDVSGNVIYATTKFIYVSSAQDRLNLVFSVYTGMLEKLKAGNITGAMTALTTDAADKYTGVLNSLGTGLASAISRLGTLQQVTLANDVAQILLVRQDASGASTGYFIYLIRGQDGIWHIDGM